MKDVTRFRGVVVVFSQHLHKSLGNVNAITFFKPSDFTNRKKINANTWPRQRNRPPDL